MKSHILIFILLFSFITVSASQHDVGKALDLLNRDIQNEKTFRNAHQSKLDSITRKLNVSINKKTFAQALKSSLELSRSYRLLNADSAMKYSILSQQLSRNNHDEIGETNAKLLLIRAMATAGIFSGAIIDFDSIRPEISNNELRKEYFHTGRLLYSYLRSYMDGENAYYDKYNKLYLQYDDSLLTTLPKGSRFYKFILGERMIHDGKYSSAQKQLSGLLSELGLNDNLYGMTAFQLAVAYRSLGDEDGYVYYLIEAARADVRQCVSEGMAIPMLAEWLNKHGKSSEAFKLINFALKNASSGGARMRTVSIASLVPEIDRDYKSRIERSRNKIVIFFCCSVALLLLSIWLMYYMIKMIRRAKKKEKELHHTARVRGKYIASFIALCSNYAERLDSLCRTVTRKVSSGQSQELLRLVSSGKFADVQDDRFYKTLDKVILDIYPDFIEKLNCLLRTEETISLKTAGVLTPELRIYAFVRMGVEESTRIAQILHLSANTVYAYRNRMRNRAIDRTSFDEDVRKLGFRDGILSEDGW